MTIVADPLRCTDAAAEHPWSVSLKAMAAAERATDGAVGVIEAARLAVFAAAPFIAAAAARSVWDNVQAATRVEGDDVEIKDQPAPDGGWDNVQALVREDLEARERVGTERYGRPLQLFNGRNAMVDAYQEVLDLACYLRQHLAEQEALETADDLVPPKAMAAAQRECLGVNVDVTYLVHQAVRAAAPFIAAAAASRPPLDELEFIDGRPTVHSHVGAPCSRCEAMDLHTLYECAGQTRRLMAGEPLNDPSPRDPEPGPNEDEQIPTPDTQLPSIPTYPLVAHLTGPLVAHLTGPTLDTCEPRAATRIVNDPSPRGPEPGPDATTPVMFTYRCSDRHHCRFAGVDVEVKLDQLGPFLVWPELRCRGCGIQPRLISVTPAKVAKDLGLVAE